MKKILVHWTVMLLVSALCSFSADVVAGQGEIPTKNYALMFHALEYDARKISSLFAN